MQVIEDRLTELEAQHDSDIAAIAERDKTIAGLQEQVKNLQMAPADETHKVDEAVADRQAVNAKELFNQVKNLI